MTQPLVQVTDEQREQLLHAVADLHAAVRQFAEACVPMVQAFAQQFTQVTKALQEAGYLDEAGKPAERPDRPAWQSPYGPPTRRH
jgi:hypothetical protein